MCCCTCRLPWIAVCVAAWLAQPLSLTLPSLPTLFFTVPQKHIDFALNSPFGGGRPGRVKRKSQASKGGNDGGEDEE